MRQVLKRNFAAAPLFAGMLLLLCALVFYYFAVLNIDYRKTALLDLGPYPDAVEYFAQAKAMAKDGWPSIQIGYDKLPSRYPFGYPTLMLPWLKALPEADSVLAPFRTNQTLGLLLLLTVFGFYAYLKKPLTGGFAALLLATLPGFFTFCRSSLSEISASVFYVLAFMFAYLGLKEERRWKLYLSAICLGLSLNIRLQSLFFAPLLLAMALFPTKGDRLRWFVHCAAVPIAFIMAASPLLVVNTILFRSPLKTGYDFWVPYWSESHLLFSFHYLPMSAAELWKEFVLSPKRYNVANIFGTGTVFVPAFMFLGFAGLCSLRFNRFVICAFLACLSFLIMTGSYKVVDLRFYLPLLILLVAVAVLPVRWATKNLFVRKHVVASLGIFVLLAAACLGYPSRSGYDPTKTGRSQAWDAVRFSTPPRQPIAFIAQGYFIAEFGQQPGIVLSDIDPVYLNAVLPMPWVAAPFDGKHHYRYSKIWRYDPPQAQALVKRGLNRSVPVYALLVPRKEITVELSRLPAVDGYQWTTFDNSNAKVLILRFTPVATKENAPL